MFKLRPRYYGVLLGLFLGTLLSLSAIVQQNKLVVEQKQSLTGIRAELKEYIQTRIKEVPAEQVRIEAREFLDIKIKENPTLKDQIFADSEGLVSTQEDNYSYRTSFMSGIVVVLGSLMYLARKKQKFGVTKKWLVLEIVGIVVVVQHVALGILNSGWYYDPLFYTLIPLWVVSAYTALFFAVPAKLGVK